MLSNLSPAIIGLVGVLLGAVISTGANYLLAVRKEAADEAKDRRSQASELKTAARLIEHEFQLGKTAAVFLAEKKRWPLGLAEKPLRAWEKYKSVLALEVTKQDWNAIVIAALSVENLASVIAMPRADDKVSDVISESSKPALSDIEAGMNALAPYTRDQGS